MATAQGTTDPAEERLVGAAGRGDERAFERLVDPYRGELHAHCYRMLGSVPDAEDALQDALLRAWRGVGRFEGRSSFRSWLYRIATNASLDAIGRRPKRVLPIDYGPPADPHDGPGKPLVEAAWVDPYPDELLAADDIPTSPEAAYEQREGIELSFVAALQHLPPLQRAALILREVLGFSAKEVAETLETTVPAVNSALQRAREAVDRRSPDKSQQETIRALGDERLGEIVTTYVDAWERGDVEGVVALLAEEVTLTMPPMPTWYDGREAVRVFLSDWAFRGTVALSAEGEATVNEGERHTRALRTSANGQPAVAVYHRDSESGRYVPVVLQVLSFEGERISEIDGFVSPAFFESFGLPAALGRQGA